MLAVCMLSILSVTAQVVHKANECLPIYNISKSLLQIVQQVTSACTARHVDTHTSSSILVSGE